MNEESSLLPAGRRPNKATQEMSGRITQNRVMVIVSLVGLIATSVYYQRQVIDLNTQLAHERSKISAMNGTIQSHELVIERFNSSVTNSDVLSRLSTLERNLNDTKVAIDKELGTVETNIESKLSNALSELNQTVAQAEHEITDEVTRVKKDFETYEVTTKAQFSMQNNFMIWQLAGTFTLLSCLISMWHMTAHLRKMNQPEIQRKVLAILWMSPIYAVTSWFSLVFSSAEGYLAIIKDAYEAYIIYQFLSFCIAVLGKGDRSAVVNLLARHADHLTPPFRLLGVFELCGCCMPEPYESNRALADAILLQCQFFAMQFVFFRPLTTTAMVVLNKMQYYGAADSPTDYRAPQFYITIIQNISIFVAFTGLLKFYHAVDKELAWCRPFAKFMTIKGVVFMTFWQGLALSILAQATDVGGQDADEWAKAAQNFLICLEMLLFSIAHFYCFPTEEWEEGYRVKHSQGGFGDSIALGDFFSDVKLILRANNGKKKKKKKALKEPAIPEGDEDTDDDRSSLPQRVDSGSSVGDDTAAMSLGSNGEAVDPKKFVADALEESLGLAGSDPDIIEAKKRLLESGVLQPEFFDDTDLYFEDDDNENVDYSEGEEYGEFYDVEHSRQPSASSDASDVTGGDLDQGIGSDPIQEAAFPFRNDQGNDESSTSDEVERPAGMSSPAPEPQSGASDDSLQDVSAAPEHERSPFGSAAPLSTDHGSSSATTPLRASIFTTVATLVESESEEALKSLHGDEPSKGI